MEFPDEILRIIKEYSLPVTRPDWRICGQMNIVTYMSEFNKIVMQRHYKIMTCLDIDYIRIYHTYKPIFRIKKYKFIHNL